MTRVHVICEGQTEETFVNEVLGPWFASKEIFLVPTLIGKRGGYFSYDRLSRDVRARLLGDTASYCTTLFDYYGSPADFPGKVAGAAKQDIDQKAACLLDALTAQLQADISAEPVRRFIPYVQMYEFEGLLFSEPIVFAKAISQPKLSTAFTAIRQGFETPEHINDSPDTAPSKRVLNLHPGYDKVTSGTIAALDISLDTIRAQCRRFDAWLAKLEALPALS